MSSSSAAVDGSATAAAFALPPPSGRRFPTPLLDLRGNPSPHRFLPREMCVASVILISTNPSPRCPQTLRQAPITSDQIQKAANFVKPDTSKEDNMDPGSYVKVKCISSGSPSDSMLVKGIVCTKKIKHKHMVSQHKNARLLILGGALGVPNRLASMKIVHEQETDYLNMDVSKIEAHQPNVLLVEKTVSSYVQECLLTREISLVLNVKRALLERIS